MKKKKALCKNLQPLLKGVSCFSVPYFAWLYVHSKIRITPRLAGLWSDSLLVGDPSVSVSPTPLVLINRLVLSAQTAWPTRSPVCCHQEVDSFTRRCVNLASRTETNVGSPSETLLWWWNRVSQRQEAHWQIDRDTSSSTCAAIDAFRLVKTDRKAKRKRNGWVCKTEEGAPSGINTREAVLVGKLQKLKTIYHLFCGVDFGKIRRKCKLLNISACGRSQSYF